MGLSGFPSSGGVAAGRGGPIGSAGCLRVHDSRFTFTSPQVWKAEYGKRKTEVALTIHDSHSHPPTGVGRWSAGCLRVHDSRFTFTSPHERRQVVGSFAFGFTIHDSHSHSHPPASVGRWSASLLSPILPLEELFHVGIHPCLFAASEAFVNLESALWPCPMVLRQAFDGTVWCATSSALSPRADFETSQRVAEADAAMRRRLGEAHGESLDRVGPCGFDPFG